MVSILLQWLIGGALGGRYGENGPQVTLKAMQKYKAAKVETPNNVSGFSFASIVPLHLGLQ